MTSLIRKRFVTEASLHENEIILKLVSMKKGNLISLSYICGMKQEWGHEG